MKIAFYTKHPVWGGLANNGGSRTVLKSVQALNEIGHSAYVVTKSDRFTWFKHEKPYVSIPDETDVVVAVTISDVTRLNKIKHKRYKKAYWMRGLERWQMQPKDIYRVLKAFDGQIICNSTWLMQKLADNGIISDVCYAGLDSNWMDMNLRIKNGKFTIGCLYNPNHRTKCWHEFEELALALGHKHHRYLSFGAHKYKQKWTHHIANPTHENLCRLYSKCDLWFAPTVLEGFHNVPAEAAMCGCTVMCKPISSNGMMDYCLPNTCYYYNKIKDARDKISYNAKKVEAMYNRLHYIGTRQQNMAKFAGMFV